MVTSVPYQLRSSEKAADLENPADAPALRL
jgi:hypothetical protein